MSEFLDLFVAAQIGWKNGRPLWGTRAPLPHRSDLLQTTIIVPSEFITDVASVPRLPLVWLIAGGRGTRSAVVHDAAYQFGFWWIINQDSGRWVRYEVNKSLTDEVFHESLLADPISGAGRVRAWEMYQAVRWGGRGVSTGTGNSCVMPPNGLAFKSYAPQLSCADIPPLRA